MANVKSVSELILDEQKLVTYVSVSKELCVHVNESKTLLQKVVDEIKKKQPNISLNVNFMLSGLLTDNSARTVVCAEANLDAQKSNFKTVFYQHIYSVSQGLAGVDNAAIVSINKIEDFPLCTGLIRNNSCTKRSSDEVETLISKSQSVVNDNIPKAVPTKENKVKPKEQNGAEDSKIIAKAQTFKSEPSIKSEIISPKKEKPSTNGKINFTNGKKPKSIAGFFSKSNSVPAIKQAKPSQATDQKIKRKSEEKINDTEKMNVDIEEVISMTDIKKEPESAKKDSKSLLKKNDSSSKKEKGTTSRETSQKSNSSKKLEQLVNAKDKKDNSLNKIKKTAKVDKKRKRVLHVSDSESDEDPFADEKPPKPESDDEIPPTPSTNTVKITSGILNPKKRRKVIDKTYTDDDGYILTRKEEIYESCSEDEIEVVKQPEVDVQKENVENPSNIKMEVSPKDKKAKTSKKKISPPQKGKQATMMNFFKKV